MASALGHLLAPQEGAGALRSPLPSQGHPAGPRLAAGRLVAQVRSAAVELLVEWSSEPAFVGGFLDNQPGAVYALSILTKVPTEPILRPTSTTLHQEVRPADRLPTVQAATATLRNLYWDAAQPPAPPSRRQGQGRGQAWEVTRPFPPLRGLLLTHGQLGIQYYSDGPAVPEQPRGALVVARLPLPPSHSYWEVEVLALGEEEAPGDPAHSPLSLGLVPIGATTPGEATWTYPVSFLLVLFVMRYDKLNAQVGSLVVHSSGKAVHYSGPSLLHWRSLRFGWTLQAGDCLGLGWERTSGKAIIQAITPQNPMALFTSQGTGLGWTRPWSRWAHR